MATIVDVLSMMAAYSLGLRNENFLFGLGYAGFDAWLVIWQRNRIVAWMTNICSRFNKNSIAAKDSALYVGALLWEKA